jgi:hypothetical protein
VATLRLTRRLLVVHESLGSALAAANAAEALVACLATAGQVRRPPAFSRH